MSFKQIDKVFCMSLDTSVDRQKEFERRFPELVKMTIFEWFITTRDTENPERGCYNSHRQVLQLGKSRGYKQIITLEDDVELLVPWSECVERINGLVYPVDWTIISIGYFPFVTKKIEGNDTVVKISCAGGCYGYISNVDGLDIPPYKGIQIDVLLFCPDKGKNYFLEQPLPNTYGAYPRMLLRSNSKTSTIDPSHDLTGQLQYNRHDVLHISTQFNLSLFVIIVMILLVISAICLGCYWHLHKALTVN